MTDRREGWLSLTKVNTAIACIVGLITIVGTVFLTVRIGVRTEVHYEFEQQVAEPKSDLNRHLDIRDDAIRRERKDEIDKAITVTNADVLSRLRSVEREVAVLQGDVKAQTEDIQELKVDVKELLRISR